MNLFLYSVLLLFGTTVAFVPLYGRQATTYSRSQVPTQSYGTINGARYMNDSTTESSSSTSTRVAPMVFLKDLLENLTGERLLQVSSISWRRAIYEAVAAPETADTKIVAKALEDAMGKPDNQFAILLNNRKDDNHLFVANFPSDTVSYDENETCWVECRLRSTKDDELLVTMGINLVQEDGKWAIQSLDWQDFRDEFYPGLSGREWLRAF